MKKKKCRKSEHRWKPWSEGIINNVGPVKGYECSKCRQIKWMFGQSDIDTFELTFEKKS